MSVSIDFRAWADPMRTRDAYCALVQRILERSVGHEVWVNERRAGKPLYRMDVSLTPDALRDLVDSAVYEYGDLVVGVAYQALSNREVGADVRVHGEKSFMRPLGIGTLSVGTLWSSWMMALQKIPVGRDVMMHDIERLLEDVSLGPKLVELRHAMDVACRDIEELFLRVCDLLGDVDSGGIKHAAVNVNEYWNTPLKSCMLYHRDVAEFGRDFARIYLLARNGYIPPETTYRREGDAIWESGAEYAGLPDAEHDVFDELTGAYYPSPPPPSKDVPVMKLLKQLDRAGADKLASLSANDIRPLLAQAVEETPSMWMKDFGDRGIVIGTRPISNFRNLYPRIAELAGTIA